MSKIPEETNLGLLQHDSPVLRHTFPKRNKYLDRAPTQQPFSKIGNKECCC